MQKQMSKVGAEQGTDSSQAKSKGTKADYSSTDLEIRKESPAVLAEIILRPWPLSIDQRNRKEWMCNASIQG